jgi:DNA-binding NtrC family response regulator
VVCIEDAMRSESGPRLTVASVLIVDDDEAGAQALTDVAEEAGYVPFVARTLSAARSILASERPSLVLLDLTLEAEYGGDLLDELSADPQAPGVVIVSAFGLAPMVAQRYAIPVVTKPFGIDRLIDVMRDTVERVLRPQKTG